MIALRAGGCLAGRHLQAIKAAPGNPHHTDVAIAPGLLGQPSDGIHGILLLLLGILVGEHTVGIAAAAHIHPHTHIAVAC